MADPQRPGRAPMTEDEIRAAWVTEPPRLAGRIELADYDPEWPRLFRREADRIRAVLGERVVRLEHVGSTSGPGLAAKPIIDILLVVPDAAVLDHHRERQVAAEADEPRVGRQRVAGAELGGAGLAGGAGGQAGPAR